MQTIKLLEKREAAPRLFVLRFEKPEGFVFKAGQFARIGLQLEGDAEPVMRAYSIASAPWADTLDFFITAVPDGQLSPRITALNPGDEALLDGDAQGNLFPERIPGGKTLWLFATGSGLAPFASILRNHDSHYPWHEIVLVDCVRTGDEAVLARELEKSFNEVFAPRSKLRLVVSTTRETDPAKAGEFCERIPALIASGELERAAGRTLTPENARALLCGNPAFIDAMRAELKKRGIISPRFGRPGQLVAETFW